MPFFITSYDLIVSEAEQMMEGECQTRKKKKKERIASIGTLVCEKIRK